ncbi:MAG: hypothetical protein RMK84_06540 [Oscillochloridaceae bacterium]|nr:hypothetical protein [Chloroflexaceae bacterium]MDW8389766.1 hypothetical protein [Oscillochloridaceae bacterium]
MHTRIVFPVLALVVALALAGCAGQSAGPSATPSPSMTPTPLPATATSAPTPLATATGAPAAPSPTLVPTALPAPAITVLPTAAPEASQIGEEILFLRNGALVALDSARGDERILADRVRSFSATPDGHLIAVTRGTGDGVEIWVLQRDGAGLRQVTKNTLAESGLSWAPDGTALVYAAAPTLPPALPEWETWSVWCATAEVRRLDLPTGKEQTLGRGCEPAFAPDGRRIAFATPPTAPAPGFAFRGAVNSIQIVNRQGANGWDAARAGGSGETDGLVVYAPTWSPNGKQVAYQRFVGYHALVDVNLTETTSSYRRQPRPVTVGAGWAAPPRYAPDGARLAVTEDNYSDARGFTGYDVWSTSALRLGGEKVMELPFATVTLFATEAGSQKWATAAAWAPDGALLAVILPAGWSPGLSADEPQFPDNRRGEIWRWRPGSEPERRLATDVEFGSPLLWLPALPALARGEAGVSLAVPAGWTGRAIAADYLIADGPQSERLAARLRAGGPPGEVTAMFPELLAPGARSGERLSLPDGSTVHLITGADPGGAPRAGALRLSSDGAVATIYLTTPERWPLEQAIAFGLLTAR